MQCMFLRRRYESLSLAKLFASIEKHRGAAYASTSGSSSASINMSNYATTGETWYAFMFSGQYYAISRVDVGASGVSLTELYKSGTRTIEISSSSAPFNIKNTSTFMGVSLEAVKFSSACDPELIDNLFTNCGKELVHYAASSGTAISQSNARIAQSAISTDGILIAAFPIEPGQECFGISAAETPTTHIKSWVNNGEQDYPLLSAYTAGSVDYYIPTTAANGTFQSSMHAYTLLRLYD